ncbi:MAG: hypothetical protein QOE44_3078, partial [Solirubrobacteraceae bacterium]|nr:hypothetical protein [Solirubrobacteraceae bacterium]
MTRLTAQPEAVRRSTPTTTSAICLGWARSPEATMIVVAPAGGWAERTSRRI